MMFKIKITVMLIGCLSAMKTENCVPCDTEKPKMSRLTTQYPENAPSSEQRCSAENENYLVIPRSDIKKLLRIKALPFLNTALTKENCCETLQPHNNIKLYHKDVNATEILNKIFYRFRGRYLKLSLNEIDINEKFTLKNQETNLIKRVNSNFATKDYENRLAVVVDSKSSESYRKKETDIISTHLRISDTSAFPTKKSKELHASKRNSRKIRFSDISGVFARRSSELEFPDVPPGNVMRVPELKLEKEYFLFGLFSRLMGYLQPTSFPIGFLKDAVQNYAHTHILVLKILKVEATPLGWIFMSLLSALALPCAVIAKFCCTTNNMERLRNETSSLSSGDMHDKWLRICLAFTMHLFLLLM
ncbi:hypothetical protein ILUMI_06794, partial [Ignelater luminosus]